VRYGSLAALKAAYDRGELTEDEPVTLDAGTAEVYADGGHAGDPSFSMGVFKMLEEALDLLGIPYEPSPRVLGIVVPAQPEAPFDDPFSPMKPHPVLGLPVPEESP
jgi:hypothetical protein